MKLILLWLVLSFLGVQQSHAASVPVSNTQNAVSGVIQAKMAKRGFAANDPRWGATLQLTGATMAGAAASAALVTVAGVTAPAWITAAVGVGLAALFAAGIDLAIDGIRWLLNSDGTVTVGVTAIAGELVEGGPYVKGSTYKVQYPAPIADSTATEDWKRYCAPWPSQCAWTVKRADPQPDHNDPNKYVLYEVFNANGQMMTNFGLTYFPSGATKSCAAGMVNNNGVCANRLVPLPGPSPKAVSDAIASMSATDKAKPANPALLAAIANAAMQKAASLEGYSGLPHDPSDPITAEDAAAWQSQNPSNWPTVGDLLSPQPAPVGGTASSPFQLPNSQTPIGSTNPSAPPNTGTNPSTQPLINLGVDPGIGAPGLENVPTAQAILVPVLNMLPSFRSFVVPSHSSTCPTASIRLFEQQLLLDRHCVLAESARPTLFAVMAFVWLFAAVLIILDA